MYFVEAIFYLRLEFRICNYHCFSFYFTVKYVKVMYINRLPQNNTERTISHTLIHSNTSTHSANYNNRQGCKPRPCRLHEKTSSDVETFRFHFLFRPETTEATSRMSHPLQTTGLEAFMVGTQDVCEIIAHFLRALIKSH